MTSFWPVLINFWSDFSHFLSFFPGSQELHVAAPTPFNKFNSLDRRALNKRQNGNGNNGLLKLATPTSGTGPESLPAVRPLINQFSKEPERRHSSYDPKNPRKVGSNTAAININGLPDPFSNRISTSVYSSQESLHRGSGGTPLRPNSSTGN